MPAPAPSMLPSITGPSPVGRPLLLPEYSALSIRLVSAAVLALGLASPALAFDPARMNDTEREAFGNAVRGYLLENPEVLMEAIGVLEERREATQAGYEQQYLTENADRLRQSPDDWAGGNLQGDVTVVEFLDYRCGYCRKAWQEVESLVEADGNVRIVYKEYPILTEDSMISSKFAIATRRIAGDDAYKKAHDTLIMLQGPLSEPALQELSGEIGVDFKAVRAEMESPAVAAIIEANKQLAMDLQINGTPTFIVNNQIVRGYIPLAALQATVEEQRKAVTKN